MANIFWNNTTGNWSDPSRWFNGVVPTGTDDVVFNASASTASILTLVTPLLAALLSLFVFAQPLAPGTALGGTLILGAGVVLFTRAGERT